MNKKIKLGIVFIVCLVILSVCPNTFALEKGVDDTDIIKVTDENKESKIKNRKMKQELETDKEESTNEISTYSMRANSYEGNVITNKGRNSNTYVYKDAKNYTYNIDSKYSNVITINRYCFETGEYKEVFTSWGNFNVEKIYGYYVQDKIIYIAFYATTPYNDLKIIGYDTQAETTCYDKTFSISDDKYYGVFCFDNNQNMYIVVNTDVTSELSILSYDKNGNQIDSITKNFLDSYIQMDITGVGKNGNVLFFALKTKQDYSTWWDDYIIKMDNGRFVDENIYLMREYGGMIWNFLDDTQTHAYNQYGEFYEIDYNANTPSRISYTIKKSIDVDGDYFYTGYLYTSDDTYVYLGGEGGILYVFNWKTYEIEKSLSIGDSKTIAGVYKIDNGNILIEYYDNTTRNFYSLSVNISDYNEVQKNLEITEHTCLTHKRTQIKNKYDELSIVNKTHDLYEQTPSSTYPYVAGTLRSQVKTDTINQINYFRWVAGVNEITQNDQYMEYSQKGAVVLGANRNLTHFPLKPSDMDDDFFTKGYAATSAGIGRSANCSWNSPIAYSIKGYVDDVFNVTKNVGHRLSILDQTAQSASFGYADTYGVVNIFASNSVIDEDKYHAWPSPGYFPVESMDPNAMWSINLPTSDYNMAGSRYVVLKANGKEYSSLNEDFDLYLTTSYNAYYFDIPQELKNYLVDGGNLIKEGKKVEVEVHGLADNFGNTYIIKYPVNFFSLDNTLTGISLPKTSAMKLGNKSKLELTTTPIGITPDGQIKWSSSNNNILSIAEDGTMTANALGEAVITAEVEGYTATCTVKVVDYLLGDVNGDGKVTLADYAKILAHVKKTSLLTGDALKAADVNGDGKVTLADYAKVLAHVKKTALLW